MYKPLPRTAVLDVSCVDGFALAAPAINRPGDNDVRGDVGWSEVTITITIQIAITRRIKITITIQITMRIRITITRTTIRIKDKEG